MKNILQSYAMAPLKYVTTSLFYIIGLFATFIGLAFLLSSSESPLEKIFQVPSLHLESACSDGRNTTVLDPKLIVQNGAPKELALEDVLAQASMANKTVILTTLNEAWAANNSMIDVYLVSFRENVPELLPHLVIVCVDQKAYARCLQLHSHCFQLVTSGVDFTAEAKYMTDDFLKMMWRRIEFMGEVLQLGYSFVFSDADIVWFRDPFAVFLDNLDFQVSTDRYQGRPVDLLSNSPNSGFLYVRSNNRTIEMYKYWYEARLRNPGKNDQHVLNAIFREGDSFGRLGVKIQFFDTDYFSCFCSLSRNITKVVTMHSNCCFGLSNKIHDLRLSLDDWRLYKYADSLSIKTISTENGKLWRAPNACHL